MPHAIITAEEIDTLNKAIFDTGPCDEALTVIKRLQDTVAAHEPGTVAQARDEYNRDGEIEVDDDAIVSRGEDDGAYVSAWVWVADEEVDEEPDEEEPHHPDCPATDGFGCRCNGKEMIDDSDIEQNI